MLQTTTRSSSSSSSMPGRLRMTHSLLGWRESLALLLCYCCGADISSFPWNHTLRDGPRIRNKLPFFTNCSHHALAASRRSSATRKWRAARPAANVVQQPFHGDNPLVLKQWAGLLSHAQYVRQALIMKKMYEPAVGCSTIFLIFCIFVFRRRAPIPSIVR